MNHNHQGGACPDCAAGKNKTSGEKLASFLGVCGVLSCYAAMFPAILIGILGIFGLSGSRTQNALNAYMNSPLFQPIFIISILLLIASLLRYGKAPLALSVVAGIGMFVSMTSYMQEWLFTLSFAVLASAYYLAMRQTKTRSLRIAFVLTLVVVLLGIIDIGQSVLVRNHLQSQSQEQSTASSSNMNMMQ